MRRLLPVLAAVALLLAGRPALADDAGLNRLVADFDAYALTQDPLTAGREGDRQALARLPDVSAAADSRRNSLAACGVVQRTPPSVLTDRRNRPAASSAERTASDPLAFATCTRMRAISSSITMGLVR